MEAEPQPLIPQILSPCSSGRSTSSDTTNSPEFEFWNMVRNPSLPPPNLLSADQLFSGGHLLPLHLLHLSSDPPQPPPEPEPSTVDSAAVSALTPSKRWMIHIFKKNDTKKSSEPSIIASTTDDPHHKGKETSSAVVKEKKLDKKKSGGSVNSVGAGKVVSATELNINIWPFSRSRSAGTGGARPRSTAASNRKVSSAPCSRSNSTGESKSRKWQPNSSPSRGVHLGRSSPVWQVRRSGGAVVKNGAGKAGNDQGRGGRKVLPPASSGSSKGRVLSLNVPMCIGYRHQVSCRSDENSAVSDAAGGGGRIGGGVSGEGLRRSNMFNIRSLFTKKVY